MEQAHLSIFILAQWLSGRLEHEAVLREVIPHHLAVCPACRGTYGEIQRLMKEVGHWDESVAVVEGREAPDLLTRLNGLPFDEQLRMIEEQETLHTWGLCNLLLRKSMEAVFDDPAAAVDMASLAVRASSFLGTAYDPAWVLDLRARCYACLGNARRVLGELRSAEDAFRKAERCLARSATGNVLIEAEVLDLKSSLRRAQRRLDEALELAGRALALYREGDDLHGVGKMLLQKAQILRELEDLATAIELLRGSVGEIDRMSEPRLNAYAHYNLLCCLVLAERHEEAEQLLPGVRDLLRDAGQPLDLVRLRWAEGNLAFGMGRLEGAEAALREVQREFLERRMGYDAALVSLDLAALYAQQGRTQELKQLALDVMPAFESRDVHREAMTALLMFQHACEQEQLTVQLARHLAAFLRRERRHPVA